MSVVLHDCGEAFIIYVLSLTAAGSPTNINATQVNLTSFSVSCDWIPGGDRGYDSGNLSAGADERTVPITGRTPGLTYNITIVALSDHLPSAVVGAVMVTLGETQILKRGGGQLLCHSCCHKRHSQLQHVLK